METKELIAKLEEYIELGHKFKTYELLKAAVRRIGYLADENEKLRERYAALVEDAKSVGPDICNICKHQICKRQDAHAEDCDFDCRVCDLDCACKNCRQNCNFEWRGENEC